MLRLGGHRIDPRNNGPHQPARFLRMTLVALDSERESALAFPAGAGVGRPVWNGRGDQFAVVVTLPSRVEVWTGTVNPPSVAAVAGVQVNNAFEPDEAIRWDASGTGLFVTAVPAGRGAPPSAPQVPNGPNMQESKGRASDTWTYQDMLGSAHDERLFDYCCAAQLMHIDAATRRSRKIGVPAIYNDINPAPDGKHLVVTRIQRPYSWLYPASFLPASIDVLTTEGATVRTVATLPLADNVSADGVRTGPRMVGWKASEPATLTWVEALDGGNPKEKAPHRDRIMTAVAPFDKPKEIHKVEHRLTSIAYARDSMVVGENNRERRWIRRFLVQPGSAVKVLDDRSSGDRYRDPGRLITEALPSGHRVVLQDGDWALFEGDGAGPTGNRPFLDRVNLATLEKTRVFQSEPGGEEEVLSVLARDGSRLIIRKQSASEPPNLYLWENGKRRALTAFKDPAPEFRRVTKRLVTYKRSDGVSLSLTLYLPPDYKEGTRLPAVMWAYPREFNDAGTAGQVSTTANRFTLPRGPSHLWLLLQGYAILDDASLPVVGGHSYGGFMTANLLAHIDLFRAGVARSGAYNRTLTPFGIPGRTANVLAGPGDLPQDVAVHACPQDQRADPVHPRHGGQQLGDVSHPVRAHVPGGAG